MKTSFWGGWCAAGMVLVLSACSSPAHQVATPSTTETTPSVRPAAPSVDPGPTVVARPVLAGPAGLIGFWLVNGTAEPAGSVVGIGSGDDDPTSITVWRACGSSVGGAWRADWSGLFVASLFEANGLCPRGKSLSAPWLTDARGYRVDGADRLLLSTSGRVLARLVPSVGPTRLPSGSVPVSTPVATGASIDQLAVGAPLPANLRPATRAELVGRWVPVGFTTTPSKYRPFIRLRAGGTWSSSDGCNGNDGPWSAGSGSAMIAAAGPNGAIGCAGASTDGWMSEVARAGFDGDVLVLVDSRGHTLGRLVPA